MDPVEQAVKRLMATVKCTVCGANYDGEKVTVLGHQEDIWFLSVACSKCRTQGLVAALVKKGAKGEVVIAASQETTHQEIALPEEANLPASAPITGDDVLDMHHFLDDFDGDFQRLFRR